MTFTIFLSHSTGETDRSLFDRVRHELKDADVEVYIAEREFAPATPSEKLKAAMARSGVVVVLMTKTGEFSSWVHTEIGMAIQASKPIVPLVEEGLDPTGPLRERDQIRFDRHHPEDALERVVRFIRSMKQPSEPRPNLDPFVTGFVVGATLAFFVILLILAVASEEG
jgi:hypothetical protein